MLRSMILVSALVWSAAGQAQVGAEVCGSLNNGENGPFDYRIERGRRLGVVEEFHFNPRVEALISGQTGSLGQDLDYVLRAFPNHHRALASMVKWVERNKSSNLPGAPLSVDCYFERALRFKPDDTISRLLFANYLNNIKRAREAEDQLNAAISLAGDNGFTHYNIGMLFADMGLFDRAIEQAHTALRLGFPRPDLRNRLIKSGHWREPGSAEAAPPAAAASQP